jgi:hypothetical protein
LQFATIISACSARAAPASRTASRRQRDDDLDEDEGDDEMMDASGDDNVEAECPNEADRARRERSARNDRGARGDRNDRGERRYSRDEPPALMTNEDRNGYERGNGADERLPMDVLPPAIGRDARPMAREASEEVEARPRAPYPPSATQDGEGDVAPAA